MPKDEVTILDQHKEGPDILGLPGEKIYKLMAVVDTNTIVNPGKDDEITINKETSIFNYEFISDRTPLESIPEIRALLVGYEIGTIRFDVQEKGDQSFRIITLNKISDARLTVQTWNGKNRYYKGTLLLPYTGLYDRIKVAPDKWHPWATDLSEPKPMRHI